MRYETRWGSAAVEAGNPRVKIDGARFIREMAVEKAACRYLMVGLSPLEMEAAVRSIRPIRNVRGLPYCWCALSKNEISLFPKPDKAYRVIVRLEIPRLRQGDE